MKVANKKGEMSRRTAEMGGDEIRGVDQSRKGFRNGFETG
jgi:hypothetical protein